MMRLSAALLSLLLISGSIKASETRIKSYRIAKTAATIRIDGNINDQGANNFAEDPNAAWRKPTR